MKTGGKGAPPEFKALGTVLAALSGLDEKQRAWVIASAASNLGIAAPTQLGQPTPLSAAATIPGQAGSKAHARAFLKAKSPANDVQRIACLAYYLTHHKGVAEFGTKEIVATNTEAGGSKIGNPSQAVDNATKVSGYLSAATKGKKQLSPYGEDVVGALPDQEAARKVMAASPKKRKRKAKK